MATRKKVKKKAKSKSRPKKRNVVKKRAAARRPARKKTTVRKKAAKKTAARKPAVAKARPAAPAAPRPAPVRAAAVATVPAAGEVRIGMVTHYYSHLMVAVVKIEAGVLREGDDIHIKGHTSDFRQRVTSMESEHAHVFEARAGQSVGIKVADHAREHDIVYRLAPA